MSRKLCYTTWLSMTHPILACEQRGRPLDVSRDSLSALMGSAAPPKKEKKRNIKQAEPTHASHVRLITLTSAFAMQLVGSAVLVSSRDVTD